MIPSSRLFTFSTIAIAFLLTLLCPGRAAADDQHRIDVSGALDWYYQYSFNRPPAGSSLFGRAWDVKHDSFSLGLAEVNVSRSPSRENPVGFFASLAAGKTTDLVHATEPGGVNTYKHLMQLYGSVLLGSRTPVTLSFGKFQAWCCRDQIEPASTESYSRSLLYTMAEPFYHMGLHASAMLTPRWMLDLYLVNGWNNVEEDNGGKSYGLMLMTMGGGPFNIMLNYIGGLEGSDTQNPAGTYGGIGFMMPGVLNVQMLNVVATWKPAERFKIILVADYADASRSGMMGGHWSGAGLILTHRLNGGWSATLRGEHFEDSDGLRTGTGQNLNSLTGTLEYEYRDRLLTRLEFRHDHAGTPFFPNANGMSRNQDTLTLAQILRF